MEKKKLEELLDELQDASMSWEFWSSCAMRRAVETGKKKISETEEHPKAEAKRMLVDKIKQLIENKFQEIYEKDKKVCRALEAVKEENLSLREFFYAYVEHIGEHLPGCDGGDGDCKCKINKLSEGR